MRRLIILGALMLPGCALTGAAGLPSSPAAVADRTVLDEQIGAGAEAAYKAERLALELAVDAGLLKGANAAKAAAIDNQAYAALKLVRASYSAANAKGYTSAASDVFALTGQMAAFIGGLRK